VLPGQQNASATKRLIHADVVCDFKKTISNSLIMQKRIILLFFILLKLGYSYSQDSILVLHPVIGEIIDNFEKKKYLLFDEIEDADFNYALIKFSSNRYYLNLFRPDTNEPSVIQIDTSQIHQYYINVTKLNEYFFNLQNSDSIDISDIETKMKEMKYYKKEINILDESLMDKIIEENIINERIKDDAETKELNEKGFKNFSKFYYPGAK